MKTYSKPVLTVVEPKFFLSKLQGSGGALTPDCSLGISTCGSGTAEKGWHCFDNTEVYSTFVLSNITCSQIPSCRFELNGVDISGSCEYYKSSDCQTGDEPPQGCLASFLCNTSCAGTENLVVICDGYQSTGCAYRDA